MAPPAALLGLVYVAAMFTQAQSSPYWSQPECPDQIQVGWTGTSYENQGPSFKQTLQEMVSETIRCIQQVIQVTKREMVLLLRQMAQDSDCEPPGIDNVTPGIHFPPPDGGYSYDRPQEQLQYPEDQPNDSQNQPPQMQMNHQTQIPQPQYLPDGQPGYYKPPTPLQEPPQVQLQTEAQLQEFPQMQPIGPPSYYQPVPIQQMPQEQPQHIPDKVTVYNTDAVSCKQNHGKTDQSHVPTSTVANRLLFPTTVLQPSSVNVESSSSSPLHVHMVERPITMEETKSPNASSGGVKSQPGAVLTSTNSSSPINPSNTTLISQTRSGNSSQTTKKNHKYEPEFHRTDIQPMAAPKNVTTDEEKSVENTPNKGGTKEDDKSIPPNNSSSSNIVNIPLLDHGSPINFPIVSYTTARSSNGIDNTTENNFTVPSPIENEVDAIMENIADANEANNKYISSSSTNASETPLDRSKANSSAIELVTTDHNNVSEKATIIISPTSADPIKNIATITTELNLSIHPDITTEITTEKYNEIVESVSTTAIDLSTSPSPLDKAETKNLSIYAIETKSNSSVHPVKSADTKSVTLLPMANEQTLLNYNSHKTTPSSVEYLSSSISSDDSTTSTSSESGSTLTQNTVTESNNSSSNTNIVTRKARL